MSNITGIIGAMQKEVDLLTEKLENTEIITLGLQTFYKGTLSGHEVVISVAGIGKVNAAATAATMINKFDVCAVINTGIAGSLNPEIGIGDTVIAVAAVEHDIDYGELNEPKGLVYYPNGDGIVINELDKNLSDKLAAAANECGINAKRGMVATGDLFVSDPAIRTKIHSKFGADVCEMEGAAIAHVCRIYGTPCGIVRAISDNANGTSSIDYPTFSLMAAANASKVMLQYFSKL